MTATSRRELDELAGDLTARYLAAIRLGDGATAEAVLREALGAGMGAAATFARVVQPALQEIGALWARGELTVGEEHLASGITKRALAAIYPLLIEDAPRGGPRVLLAGVGGELHSIGLRMISDVLDSAGFETTYLGPSTPATEIADAVRRHRPQLVGLSVTMPLEVVELDRAVVAVGEADPAVSVMVGGRGVPARMRDYSGYVRDAESVIAAARRLLAGAPVLPPTPPLTDAPPPRTPAAHEPDWEVVQTTTQLADVARAQARRARDFRALALTDPVTGLPNRRAWDERYEVASARGPLAVAILDLDHFKAVNDHDGHAAGDLVLERVGTAIRSVLRTEDFAARLGGDEFGVLLPQADDAAALAIAERIRAAITRALVDKGVTASIGVARHAGSRRATTLAADQALYRAKREGGDRVERAA